MAPPPPPWRWCLLGDLCFLCVFLLVTRQSEVSYLRAFVLHRTGQQDSACAQQQSCVRVRGGGVVLANNHVNEEINEVFGL